MGLAKKIGDQIKESVPEEYQKPQEEHEEVGVFEPIEETSKKDPSNATRQLSELENLNYINFQIKYYEEKLNNAEQVLKDLMDEVNTAKRRIQVLKVVKNNNLNFDVKWLINRIGELKDRPDGLKQLETEIFDFIEEEIEKNDRIKK